ncbi:sigma-70 family RNA polymerase sigma factor [Schumannella soli]|uniref:Sigma-70 family RNA polymerase sigma factor n=1 Tax=Schumannella soli TaxID=2590779 RepID=A0A506XZI5_9MICO|nr:sigma-70 family RNA polymerase sigma factor [Schumannella soli]TPW74810.1 sigma-70 family RNA polymerase sigma factor [Schumannella soli]
MPAFTTLDFDEFLDADFRRAVSAVGVISGDRELARQAVEDVLVGLVQRPPARVIENRIAWVVVVASERAEKLAREQRRAERHGEVRKEPAEPVATTESAALAATTAPSETTAPAETTAPSATTRADTDPADAADPALVIQSRMLQRMRGLPLRARQVGVLSYQLGLSIERIGEGIGVPAAVVSQELQRMRAAVFPPRATSAAAAAPTPDETARSAADPAVDPTAAPASDGRSPSEVAA